MPRPTANRFAWAADFSFVAVVLAPLVGIGSLNAREQHVFVESDRPLAVTGSATDDMRQVDGALVAGEVQLEGWDVFQGPAVSVDDSQGGFTLRQTLLVRFRRKPGKARRHLPVSPADVKVNVQGTAPGKALVMTKLGTIPEEEDVQLPAFRPDKP